MKKNIYLLLAIGLFITSSLQAQDEQPPKVSHADSLLTVVARDVLGPIFKDLNQQAEGELSFDLFYNPQGKVVKAQVVTGLAVGMGAYIEKGLLAIDDWEVPTNLKPTGFTIVRNSSYVTVENSTPVARALRLPKFENGRKDLEDYIQAQFPLKEMKGKKISFAFIVNERGQVRNIKFNQQLEKKLNDQLIEILERMPRWEPATINRRIEVYNESLSFAVDRQGVISFRPETLAGTGSVDVGAYISERIDLENAVWNSFSDGDMLTMRLLLTTDGKVDEAKIVRGKDAELDKVLTAIMKDMPALEPAILNNTFIRSSYTVSARLHIKRATPDAAAEEAVRIRL